MKDLEFKDDNFQKWGINFSSIPRDKVFCKCKNPFDGQFFKSGYVGIMYMEKEQGYVLMTNNPKYYLTADDIQNSIFE